MLKSFYSHENVHLLDCIIAVLGMTCKEAFCFYETRFTLLIVSDLKIVKNFAASIPGKTALFGS